MVNKILFFLLLLFLIPSVDAAWLNSTTSADAYVETFSPNANYGSGTTIYLGSNSVNNVSYRSFIKFDLSSIPAGATVNDANFSFYVTGVIGAPIIVYLWNTSASWNEGTVTWNNQPSKVYNFTTITIPSASTTRAYSNVTLAVQSIIDGTNNGWVLISSTDGQATTHYLSANSKENGDDIPWLNVSYVSNSAPTTPIISFPLNLSRHYNNTINATWNISTDADSDPLTYNWQMSNFSNFSNPLEGNTSNNYTGSLTTKDGLLNYTRVRAFDSYLYSNWSDVVNFTENTVSTLTNISDTYLLNVSDTLSIFPTSTDSEGDTPTFARDFTNGTFYSNNGTLLWTTIASDSGIKTWTINVSDGYEVTSKTFYVSVNSSIPTVPYSIANTTGNFFVNTTWEKGLNTDTFNVSVNGTWTNGTAANFTNSSVGVRGYQNISICGYNIASDVMGACTSYYNTSIPDNLPTYGATSLSNTAILTTETVVINIKDVIDLDSDNLTVIAGITLAAVGTEVNYSMTNSDGNNYTYSFSSLTSGTYTVTHFYINNAYGNTTKADTLQFTVTTPIVSSGSSGGNGGGGSTIIIKEDTPVNATSGIIFRNVTDFRSSSDLQTLGECLSESILLPNKCTSGKIVTAIVTDVANWWIMGAAYIMSFFTVLGLAIANQKPRRYVQDSLLYGTLTIVIILFLQLMGFSLYIVNYAFNNPSPGLMSISIAAWAMILSIVGDSASYKKYFRDVRL